MRPAAPRETCGRGAAGSGDPRRARGWVERSEAHTHQAKVDTNGEVLFQFEVIDDFTSEEGASPPWIMPAPRPSCQPSSTTTPSGPPGSLAPAGARPRWRG